VKELIISMSLLHMLPTYTDEWIKGFDPHKRVLKGNGYLIAKRIMDIGIVLLASPFWIPIMLVASIGIVATDSLPVFFVQYRTGKGGKRFKMYKFRTMVKNAEELKKDLAIVNEKGELSGPLKLQNDPRITRFGKFLRKTSIDELPQVLNVLIGDMSLVGPRPTSWSSESYKLWHTERLDVLPGITGLWQVFGRGSEDFDEWLRWDIRYIERRSIWLDLSILVKTVTMTIKQRGAR
jgi:lipopolysaccharide/colanic/teichoic acid biosynthesis glycosyltransferase